MPNIGWKFARYSRALFVLIPLLCFHNNMTTAMLIVSIAILAMVFVRLLPTLVSFWGVVSRR